MLPLLLRNTKEIPKWCKLPYIIREAFPLTHCGTLLGPAATERRNLAVLNTCSAQSCRAPGLSPSTAKQKASGGTNWRPSSVCPRWADWELWTYQCHQRAARSVSLASGCRCRRSSRCLSSPAPGSPPGRGREKGTWLWSAGSVAALLRRQPTFPPAQGISGVGTSPAAPFPSVPFSLPGLHAPCCRRRRRRQPAAGAVR